MISPIQPKSVNFLFSWSLPFHVSISWLLAEEGFFSHCSFNHHPHSSFYHLSDSLISYWVPSSFFALLSIRLWFSMVSHKRLTFYAHGEEELFFCCDSYTEHRASGAHLHGCVLSSRAPRALWWRCLWNRAVLEACVLHRIGVWIFATGGRGGAEAGTYRVWWGNRLQ